MDKHLSKAADEVIETLKEKNKNANGSKVLITGGAGFLGAHFVHYFLRLNDTKLNSSPAHIYVNDNFLRGLPDWLKALQGRSDVTIIESDIIETTSFPKVDYIIHGASIASPTYYRIHPIKTMDANVIGLRNILEHAKADRAVKSVLFFSSSEIYGDPSPDCIPTAEDYRGLVSCTGPRACYDESKRYGETLCVNFWREHKVPVKIARPFNNYGPGLKITDRRVLPDFFKDVLKDQDLVMLSDGSATRTFCYITDAITGYLLMLFSDQNGESFNIGTEKPEISMSKLAEMVIQVSGKKLKVIRKESSDKEYLTDNPNRRCPQIGKARKLLGYEPKVGLEEGLRKTYEYYLDNPVAEES